MAEKSKQAFDPEATVAQPLKVADSGDPDATVSQPIDIADPEATVTQPAILADDEGVEVDAGYTGDHKFKPPETASSRVGRKQKSVVRGRHENVNGRLKIFDVLNIPFRHLQPRSKMMEKHARSFEAIAVITQLKFENGESLYDVPYDLSYE